MPNVVIHDRFAAQPPRPLSGAKSQRSILATPLCRSFFSGSPARSASGPRDPKGPKGTQRDSLGAQGPQGGMGLGLLRSYSEWKAISKCWVIAKGKSFRHEGRSGSNHLKLWVALSPESKWWKNVLGFLSILPGGGLLAKSSTCLPNGLFQQPLPRVFDLPSLFKQSLPMGCIFQPPLPRIWSLPGQWCLPTFQTTPSEGLPSIFSKTDTLGHDSAKEETLSQT